MKKHLHIFIILSICWNAAAAQSTDSEVREKYPALNGHRFSSTSYMNSSFITTHLQADIGYGTTSLLEIPGLQIDEYELFSFTGKVMYLDLDIQYQQGFTPWLALYATIKMAGRLGTDMSTILVDGVNTLSGGTIGWLVRVMNTQKFNMAASVQLSRIDGSFINVPEFIEEVIDNEPYPSVRKNVPSLTAGVGLRGAYAFSPSFGLQFNGDYFYGESFQRGNTRGYIALGVLGDVDFNPKREVPIGLSLGYMLSSSP